MIYLLLIVYLCLLLSYLMFVPSLVLSHALGAIDYPSKRKIHSKPTARGGGFAVFCSFTLFLIILPLDIGLKIPIALSATTIFLIGFFDDVIDLSPFTKLLGQLFALSIYYLISESLNYKMSAMEGIFSAVWIIFITNATNLLDGLDGLAGGVCASETLCLAVISILWRNNSVLLCSLLLLGAILGFLPRNFPHAKIFMGDCGALFLGFTLGILSSRLAIESNSIICILALLLVFRIPIYDTNLSIIRRLIKRKNPFKADKGHFHHLLLKHGFTKECASLALITASLLFGFLGVIISLI